jgi:NDP-sugar pyrophosphorylase family protein
MKAMILAAGVGRRLRPLTDACPKALIEVGGVPMLEIVVRRLMQAGVREIVVNVFHLADRVEDFLKARKHFGIRVELSREAELLDTGGGLKRAAAFFDDGEPFFLHNVDVLSSLDLDSLYRYHLEHPALATLAVRARKSSRCFLFDREGRLCGWESLAASRASGVQAAAEKKTQWAGPPAPEAERLAFDGIHIISPELIPKMTETGIFPIASAYLRLAGQGEKIQAYRSDGDYWGDIGSTAKLEAVRRHVQEQGLPV